MKKERRAAKRERLKEINLYRALLEKESQCLKVELISIRHLQRVLLQLFKMIRLSAVPEAKKINFAALLRLYIKVSTMTTQ